jgi:hypothetical protein
VPESEQYSPPPQSAAGKVLMHFAVSMDGFVAGPDHDMSFMEKATVRDDLHRDYIQTTGAILAGRAGFDSAIGDSRPYGGAWRGRRHPAVRRTRRAPTAPATRQRHTNPHRRPALPARPYRPQRMTSTHHPSAPPGK